MTLFVAAFRKGGALTLLYPIYASTFIWAALLAFLFVAAFRKGGSLTLLYPIYASTFIWAALLAFVFQAIPIRPANVAGMGLPACS
jgi:hypothetical protein